MILLVLTTDKLQLITSAAATVDVHASFMDYNGSTVTPGKQNTAITTATTTDIVAAPGASTQRNVKTLHVRNKHASLSCDVTVVYDANGTDYELHKVTLFPGTALEYIEGVGFFTLATNIVSTVVGVVSAARLSADQSNSTTTPTEVTGLSVTTGVGTFVFKYHILYQSAAATTGVRFDMNHTGTVTSFVWFQRWSDLSATASTAVPDQDNIGAAGHVTGSFASRAKGTAGRGTTLSVDTAAGDMLMIIEGLCIVTVTGDLELWHGSEVAAQSTVRAGSSLVLIKTA